MHRIQSVLILGTLIAIFGFVGFTVFGGTAALLIVLFAFLVNFGTQRSAARMILRLHNARPLRYHEAPSYHAIARELADRASIPVPELAVYPSDQPNAFALSLSRQEGVLAVSTGLTRLLDTEELRGVLAHEIAHLKNRDSLVSVSAGLFVQSISTVASVFGFLLFFLAMGGYMPTGLVGTALLVISAPYAARFLQAGLMRTRERMADQDAALLTGNPRALASALTKLERYNRYLRGIYRRFRFIYTTGEDAGPDWMSTHPPTEERVRDLLALEGRVAPIGRRPQYRYVV